MNTEDKDRGVLNLEDVVKGQANKRLAPPTSSPVKVEALDEVRMSLAFLYSKHFFDDFSID